MATVTHSTSVPQPLLSPLTDDRFLVEVLCELTSQDQETVWRRLQKEEQSLGSNVIEAMSHWQLQPYVWSDKLVEFYKSTDAFLFETLIWNRHPTKNEMRDWIGKYLHRTHQEPVRILTYGDGLGIDSLYCVLAGHQVDYYEVSERCVEFSRRLAKRLDVDLNVVSNREQIELGSYDYVICLDVLEHVPDPPEVVAEIVSYLKPDGKLIVHAPFWYLSPSVPTHLASNLTYSGEISRLYGVHGLKPVDAMFFWNPIVLQKVNPTNASQIKIPLGNRARIAGGGLLLKGARYWRWPYQIGAKLATKKPTQTIQRELVNQ